MCQPGARALLIAAASLSSFHAAHAATTFPNGIASGDTTATSSFLWTRSTVLGDVMFEYATDPGFTNIVGSEVRTVVDPTVPVKAQISGLDPNQRYYVRATDASLAQVTGTFKTAAAAGTRAGLRFGATGDWRGELSPYPAIKNAPGRELDLLLAIGDTIYADFESPALPGVSQAQTLPEFRVKHAEVYGERFGANTWADLRASTSILANIDDHEVTNDFAGGASPASDPRFAGQPGNFINETPLYQNGLQAFTEYNPIANETWQGTGDARFDGKPKLYRERTYGDDASFFTLDARSFRDEALPAVADPLDPVEVGTFLAQSFDPTRTMLGAPQTDALKQGLLDAQAAGTTWKFVSVPEPIQNLGVVGAQDRFEGYAAERADILRFIEDNGIENVVFIAADVHGTVVNNLTYQDAPGAPQIATGAFEVTTGSVAFDAPFGPTVADIAFAAGLPGALDPAIYAQLSPVQQEAYIQGLIDAQITPLGYDPVGLDNNLPQAEGRIDAELLEGGWTATNTFGWTEFDIDPLTQELVVTTWGIDAYTQAQLEADPAAILALEPAIVQQFRVTPIPAPGVVALGAIGLAGLARRRR
jgi:phosphodiesterase/alkaline phosphatase D-like protein